MTFKEWLLANYGPQLPYRSTFSDLAYDVAQDPDFPHDALRAVPHLESRGAISAAIDTCDLAVSAYLEQMA